MEHEEWSEVLRSARSRPAFYVGSEERGHLFAVVEPLRLAWESRVFADLRAASVVVSPTQYHLKIESGPLVTGIERLVAWGQCPVLIEELGRVGQALMQKASDSSSEWFRRFVYTHLGSPAFPLILAERGLIGLRTTGGMWCQTYEHGSPHTAPFLIGTATPIGLVVAAALSSEYFTGLPFVPEEIEPALPDAARPHVQIEYRPVDDLVTERVLEPANVSCWL